MFDVSDHDGFEIALPLRRPLGVGFIVAVVAFVALMWLFVRVELPRTPPPADCITFSGTIEDSDRRMAIRDFLAGRPIERSCFVLDELPSGGDVEAFYRRRRLAPGAAETLPIWNRKGGWYGRVPLWSVADLQALNAEESQLLELTLLQMASWPDPAAEREREATLDELREVYLPEIRLEVVDRVRRVDGLLTPGEAAARADLMARVQSGVDRYEDRRSGHRARVATARTIGSVLLGLKVALTALLAGVVIRVVRSPSQVVLRRAASIVTVGDRRLMLADGWQATADGLDLILSREGETLRLRVDPLCTESPEELAAGINAGIPALGRDPDGEAAIARVLRHQSEERG